MNKEPNHTPPDTRTWLWLALMLAIIAGTGLSAFFWISDRGHPDWDFRSIRDVPGQSPHATYELLPHPQHVRGREGE